MDSRHSVRTRAMELIGSLLCDRWRVRRVLGIGGMSTVYEAVHRNGNRVAIKVLNPEGALCPRVRRRFLREGYLANSVGHPGAVTVIDDAATADGKVFLVMELLEGESLGSRLRRRSAPLPPREVLTVADRVLDVLACAHDRGIVHRDVKPDNVFVTRTGVLKLLDFGIASVRDLCELGVDVTRSGSMLGTPAFMAPEQARGAADEVDGRTDLWAVGAMMFTLLTRRHVHEGKSSNEVFVAAATEAAPSIAVVSADLERGIVDLVDRALRFDRAQRWPDARSMQARVRELIAEGGAVLPEMRGDPGELDSITLPFTGNTEHEVSKESHPPSEPQDPGSSPQIDWSWNRDTSARPSRRALRGVLRVPAAVAIVVIAAFAWTKAGTVDEKIDRPGARSQSTSESPSRLERPTTLETVDEGSGNETMTAPIRNPAGENRADVPTVPAPAPLGETHPRPAGVARTGRATGAGSASGVTPSSPPTTVDAPFGAASVGHISSQQDRASPLPVKVDDPDRENAGPVHRLVPRDAILDRRD